MSLGKNKHQSNGTFPETWETHTIAHCFLLEIFKQLPKLFGEGEFDALPNVFSFESWEVETSGQQVFPLKFGFKQLPHDNFLTPGKINNCPRL